MPAMSLSILLIVLFLCHAFSYHIPPTRTLQTVHVAENADEIVPATTTSTGLIRRQGSYICLHNAYDHDGEAINLCPLKQGVDCKWYNYLYPTGAPYTTGADYGCNKDSMARGTMCCSESQYPFASATVVNVEGLSVSWWACNEKANAGTQGFEAYPGAEFQFKANAACTSPARIESFVISTPVPSPQGSMLSGAPPPSSHQAASFLRSSTGTENSRTTISSGASPAQNHDVTTTSSPTTTPSPSASSTSSSTTTTSEPTASASPDPSSSSGGFTKDQKIALGCGLGTGLPLIILGVLTYIKMKG